MQYEVINRTLSYNKPGLSPTQKNGVDQGWVNSGFIFTPGMSQNGWLAIQSNKWVKSSDCKAIEVPPPVLPPIKQTVQIRLGIKQGGVTTWQEIRQFTED